MNSDRIGPNSSNVIDFNNPEHDVVRKLSDSVGIMLKDHPAQIEGARSRLTSLAPPGN
jgi:hypothetical protein